MRNQNFMLVPKLGKTAWFFWFFFQGVPHVNGFSCVRGNNPENWLYYMEQGFGALTLPSDLGNSDGYHVVIDTVILASQIKSPLNIKVNGIISRKYAFCH